MSRFTRHQGTTLSFTVAMTVTAICSPFLYTQLIKSVLGLDAGADPLSLSHLFALTMVMVAPVVLIAAAVAIYSYLHRHETRQEQTSAAVGAA